MVVNKIFCRKLSEYKCDDIYLNGNIFNEITDFFTYPLPSREIGVYNVKNLDRNNVEIKISMVEIKCILTTFDNESIALALLH